MRVRGVFLNRRSMDNLFFKTRDHARGGQDSRQGIVKKEQESIFENSIGSLHKLQFLLKMRFISYAPVLSNVPYATQTAPDLKKDDPFR